MQPSPVAFMSYATRDNDGERLTQLREALSKEVRIQTGEDFPIFQDCEDIKLGQDWKERLENSIDDATFFIPIITPSFFRSEWCRRELQRFIEREQKLGRNDLILPIYYVRCPVLENRIKLAKDELAQLIAARQRADWRHLRFKSFETEVVKETLAEIAEQIAETLERVHEVPPQTVPKQPAQPKVPQPEEKSIWRPFDFEVVTVNAKGKVIKRQPGSAQLFQEDLGGGVELEMVLIPGGKFMMGSPEDEEGRDIYRWAPEPWNKIEEGPRHEVIMPSFCLGRYPVTQAQYEAVMGQNPSHFIGKDRPVETVSWWDAVALCTRLTQLTANAYRLPSEAEWEYACRAGTQTPFHFGLTISDEIVNYRATSTYGGGPKGNFQEQTTDVGQFSPNAFGLCDMHGNIWEWCEDHSHDIYDDAPTDGKPWLNGNDNDSRRMIRGGSWYRNPRNCRSATRSHDAPDVADEDLGFRLACFAPSL